MRAPRRGKVESRRDVTEGIDLFDALNACAAFAERKSHNWRCRAPRRAHNPSTDIRREKRKIRRFAVSGVISFANRDIRGRCLPGDGKWMGLEFAGGLFGTGLYWLEIVIRVNY